LPQQQAVAQAIWNEIDDENRTYRLNQLREQLTNSEWNWNWPEGLKGPYRAELSAALLLHAHPTQLQRHLWDVTEPRVALKIQHPHGFAAYERPGELSGSALLTHPAALRPYARALVQQAHAEGLAYVELRGSPHKYRPDDPAAWLTEFRAALQEAGAVTQDEDVGAPLLAAPRMGFIWILDRRQRATLPAVVRQAVAAVATQTGFLLGLDLAGDEGTHNPADLAPSFLPVFEACLPVTIHAGEGESAEHIWQASYHLHADRIGHGLTLVQHRELMHRFRDRGICLELCPTSNREVVGFADPDVPASRGLPPYPLREFLDAGLPVSLCTDNPGISRTTLADEYLTAARMTPDGLTLWDVLALMRQSFVHAFLPAAQRERLLKAVDEAVFKQVAADA
jgi:adenosine deaminase